MFLAKSFATQSLRHQATATAAKVRAHSSSMRETSPACMLGIPARPPFALALLFGPRGPKN